MVENSITVENINDVDLSMPTQEQLVVINKICTMTADINSKMFAELFKKSNHKNSKTQITVEEIESMPVTSTIKQMNVVRKRINKEKDVLKKYLLTIAFVERVKIIHKYKVRIKKLEDVLCEIKPKQSLLKKLTRLIFQR